MAEDPSAPSNELESRSSQSTVARILLSGTVHQSRGDGNRDCKSEDGGSSSTCALKVVVPEAQVEDDQSFEVESIEDASPTVQDGDSSFSQSELSPDGYAVTASSLSSSGRLYSCRFCDFSTMTYTHLQLHMPRHGGL